MAVVIGKDRNLIRQCTCYKCASVIEYELREVNTKYISDYLGDKDMIEYIICPGCGTDVTVRLK